MLRINVTAVVSQAELDYSRVSSLAAYLNAKDYPGYVHVSDHFTTIIVIVIKIFKTIIKGHPLRRACHRPTTNTVSHVQPLLDTGLLLSVPEKADYNKIK